MRYRATCHAVLRFDLTTAVALAAGLFFFPAPRFHAGMDADLETVIRQALADARAAGRDHLTQTELAVRAVLKARPDMTASEALTAAELVRRL